MFKIENSTKGFSLAELLTVVGIIGILATFTIVIINPLKQYQMANDAQRKSDMRQVQSALEMYRSDAGTYPASITCGNALANGSTTYLTKIPCDPKTGWTAYTFTFNPGGCAGTAASPCTLYTLVACLENTSDPQGSGACGTGIKYTVNNP